MSLAEERARLLAEVYARIPRIACKGLCSECCGPIAYSNTEATHLKGKYGRLPVLKAEVVECSELTPDKRCAIYEDRPTICRLWGVVRTLRCPFGCVPEGGYLPDAKARQIMASLGMAVRGLREPLR